MSREILAWALAEKHGGRKGKLLTIEAAPDWFPIRTALFTKKAHAYMRLKNTQTEDKYEIVRVKITVEKVNDEQHGSTSVAAD